MFGQIRCDKANILVAFRLATLIIGVAGCSGKVIGQTDGGKPDAGLCKDGEHRPAGDACNTCTCVSEHWACTRLACKPASTVCTDGLTKDAGDSCNTCTCVAGEWACTERACLPPEAGVVCGGSAGNTCKGAEYCAYTDGAFCGGTGALAVCRTKPAACSRDLNPVCGCDGKTYDNPCLAAMAGTSIRNSSACFDPCAGGRVTDGCPCTAPSENLYCCEAAVWGGKQCKDGIWTHFYGYPCGSFVPDAARPDGGFAGSVICLPPGD